MLKLLGTPEVKCPVPRRGGTLSNGCAVNYTHATLTPPRLAARLHLLEKPCDEEIPLVLALEVPYRENIILALVIDG